MNWNPGTSYRGDQWIMQGGQQMQQAMTQLLQYYMGRGTQANELRAQAETLAGPDAAAPAGAGPGAPAGSEGDTSMGGFNPVTPSNGAGGEDQGPSPAAQRGTQADALRKVIQSYAPGEKDLHTALKGMSVDQLEGMLKGYALKQSAAEHAARLDDYQAQAQLRRQNALDDQTVGKLIKAYGTYEPQELDDSGNPVEAPGERLRHAFTQVPEAGGRALPKAVEALTRYEQLLNPKKGEEDLASQFVTNPKTGYSFLTRGRTSLPAGVDPTVAQPQEPQAHFDEVGKVTGFSEFDAKRGWIFKEAKNTGLKRAVLEDGSVLPGYVQSADGKIHDTRTAMEKAFGASAGAPSALTIPKKKADLEKGKEYQTRYGVATWDGEKFVTK